MLIFDVQLTLQTAHIEYANALWQPSRVYGVNVGREIVALNRLHPITCVLLIAEY